MMVDWRWRWAFPLLGRVPTRLPWHLAARLGRDPAAVRRATQVFLQSRFAQVFPQSTESLRERWAQAHMDMLAAEMLDAAALHRLGRPGGPRLAVDGWEPVYELQRSGRGFILVLNHFDRLVSVAVALARRGVVLNMLTMPVLENPGLSLAQRKFLMHKINSLTTLMRGQWRTSAQSLRAVHEGLRKGQAWIILADAWAPEFARMRDHDFLGGQLQLPTGIERMARTSGAALVHGRAFTMSPDAIQVKLEVMREEAGAALDQVIAQLEHDVLERPWAWWHWGQWDQMWRPYAAQREG